MLERLSIGGCKTYSCILERLSKKDAMGAERTTPNSSGCGSTAACAHSLSNRNPNKNTKMQRYKEAKMQGCTLYQIEIEIKKKDAKMHSLSNRNPNKNTNMQRCKG